MYYAQFYKDSTGYVPNSIPPVFDPAYVKPIPACGSDGVLILDGRLSVANMFKLAYETAQKRGYIALAIFCGERFDNAVPVSGRYTVYPKAEDRTASSATHGA